MFRGRSHRRATKRVVRHERKETVSLLSMYGKRQGLASDTLLKPELFFADCSVLHDRDVKYEGFNVRNESKMFAVVETSQSMLRRSTKG